MLTLRDVLAMDLVGTGDVDQGRRTVLDEESETAGAAR